MTTAQTQPPIRRVGWSGRDGRRLSKLATHLIAVAVAIAGLCLVPLLGLSSNGMNLVDLWLVYSVSALGYLWVLGLAGRYAFCHTFMMAIGGYSAAWADARGAAFLVALGVALATSALAAIVVGALMWRVRQFYFAIGTLAVGEIGFTVLSRTSEFTGTNGNVHGISYPSLFGHSFVGDEQIFYLFLGALAIMLVLTLLLINAPVGRDLTAARETPEVARTCGIPVRRLHFTLFVLGSAVGGLAGALVTYWVGFIGVDSFGLDLSIGLLLIVIMGGLRSPIGIVLATAFYVFLPAALSGLSEYMPMIFGAVLLVTIMLFPNGIAAGLKLKRRSAA